MPEYSFTREFAEEGARRFAAGDTIGEIADDTCNTPGDVEELLRVQIRAMSLRKDKVRKIHHVVPFRGQRKAIFHRQIRIHRMIPPGCDSEMFLLIITHHGFARKARAQNRSWQR